MLQAKTTRIVLDDSSDNPSVAIAVGGLPVPLSVDCLGTHSDFVITPHGLVPGNNNDEL